MNFGRQVIRQHCQNAFLAAILHGLFVVPAFKAQHGHGLFHAAHLGFRSGQLALEKFLPLGVGGAALGAPLHKLPNIPDLQAGTLQAFDDVQALQFAIGKAADAGGALHAGEKTLFIVVAQGGNRQTGHAGDLTNAVIHNKSLLIHRG